MIIYSYLSESSIYGLQIPEWIYGLLKYSTLIFLLTSRESNLIENTWLADLEKLIFDIGLAQTQLRTKPEPGNKAIIDVARSWMLDGKVSAIR